MPAMNKICIICLLTIMANDNSNKCEATKKLTELLSREEGIVTDDISKQEQSKESVMGRKRKKTVHHPLVVNILPFIMMMIFSLMIVHIMRLLILSSSNGSASGHVLAVAQHLLPFVCKKYLFSR